MDPSLASHPAEWIPDSSAEDVSVRSASRAYPRWFLWCTIIILTLLPVAFFMLAPLIVIREDFEPWTLGAALLLGMIFSLLLSRRLLTDNPEGTLRRRVKLLAIVAGFELLVWPGLWVLILPIPAAERTLWQIDSPEKPTTHFSGTYEIANYTGVAEGVGFQMNLLPSSESTYGLQSGVLTTSPDREGNIEVWKLTHAAQSGDEIRLHFRPQFPYFWHPGITLVGHLSDKRKLERGEISGKMYFHLRGGPVIEWLFDAER